MNPPVEETGKYEKDMKHPVNLKHSEKIKPMNSKYIETRNLG